jgi:intracellular multiplication protein IcmE
MSTIQADVGRQSKAIIFGVALIAAVAAYLVYTYAAADNSKNSSINAIQPGRGTTVPQSEHYGEVLDKYNKQQAGMAAEKGETYVSVFSSRPQAVVPAETTQLAGTQEAAAQSTQESLPHVPPTQASQPPAPAREARINERLDEQAKGLLDNWASTAHSAARVSEADFGQAAAIAAKAGSAVSPEPASQPRRLIVPALTLAPAILGTDIDTDENSMVEATIPSGEHAGATVFAMGYKRQNNSVDMTFTMMKWQGRSYRINAKSIDKDSMRSVLSGEVNNRYLSRILLPALALGLGRTGQMFEQSDTQSVITPFGTVVQSRSGTPSGRSVVGAMVGGAATEAGQVLRSDAAQFPTKQVLIPRSETIGVRFIEPVFASDELGTQPSVHEAAGPVAATQPMPGLPPMPQ